MGAERVDVMLRSHASVDRPIVTVTGVGPEPRGEEFEESDQRHDRYRFHLDLLPDEAWVLDQ